MSFRLINRANFRPITKNLNVIGCHRAIRQYSSESHNHSNNGGSSSNKLIFATGSAALGLGFYYLNSYNQGKRNQALATIEEKVPLQSREREFQKVYNEVYKILENEDYDDGSYAPNLLRLAWHASGTYDKKEKIGGSNKATMRFKAEAEDEANNGLHVARNLLEEKIKVKFPWISYGDLWTLAAVCAIQEMGGPKIAWRSGRIDGTDEREAITQRLPDGAKDENHIRQVFYRLGFTDQETVALIGAHAVGRCHADRSGFDGPWSFSPITFSNEYFKLLLNSTWKVRDWDGPKQFQDEESKSLMMLPTDFTLRTDPTFRKEAEKYANDEELFFKDFANAFAKLIELGVPTRQLDQHPPIFFKTSDQVEAEEEENQKE